MSQKCILFVLSLLMSLPLSATTPAEKTIDASIEAAGGWKTFEALGVLKMKIRETNFASDGAKTTNLTTAYVDTTLSNSRLEMPNNLVIVRNGDTGWATFGGKLDKRQNTPRMAPGTCRQKLMHLLLPFSLKLKGQTFSKPSQTSFDGQKMTKIDMTVADLFFQNPLVSKSWELFFPSDASKAPVARFMPVPQFNQAKAYGMEIHVEKRVRVKGVLLPSEIRVNLIDSAGKIQPQRRSVSIEYTVLDDPGLGLFLSPEALKDLEEGNPID